jgi:hypothetical protein
VVAIVPVIRSARHVEKNQTRRTTEVSPSFTRRFPALPKLGTVRIPRLKRRLIVMTIDRLGIHQQR